MVDVFNFEIGDRVHHNLSLMWCVSITAAWPKA